MSDNAIPALADRCQRELVRRFESLWGKTLPQRVEEDRQKAASAWQDSPTEGMPSYATYVELTMKADGRKVWARLTERFAYDAQGLRCDLEWTLEDAGSGRLLAMGLNEAAAWLAGYAPGRED